MPDVRTWVKWVLTHPITTWSAVVIGSGVVLSFFFVEFGTELSGMVEVLAFLYNDWVALLFIFGFLGLVVYITWLVGHAISRRFHPELYDDQRYTRESDRLGTDEYRIK